MDQARATRMASELEGKSVGMWKVTRYINCGKSALVFEAVKNGKVGALKVFDPELVERYGHEKQLARIEREKTLIGREHKYLIPIYDGGYCPETGSYYIVMGYLPQKNLSEVITKIPRDKIIPIINQVSSAARFLLQDLGLAHRDIKPENICISDDYSSATLLDLGVLRPVGFSDVTDHEGQRVFVGTLRYSPPELLYRTEDDSIEGWSAVTIYQIGAVLHDMIERRPLFWDIIDPYARLVDAVRESTPIFIANDVDEDIVLLSRSCLIKEPAQRRKAVSWDQLLGNFPEVGSVESYKERMLKRRLIAQSSAKDKNNSVENATWFQMQHAINQFVKELDGIIRSIATDSRDCFPRFEIWKSDPENDHCLLSVCFESSASHCIYKDLKFKFKLKVTALKESLVELSYCLEEVDKCSGTSFDDREMNIFYEGIFAGSSIEKHLQEVLYKELDKAQAACKYE